MCGSGQDDRALGRAFRGDGAAPARVRHFVATGRRHDWDFVVMYGATEATARMAYLPTELTYAHPTCIGIPIPGGAFDIDPALFGANARHPTVTTRDRRTQFELALTRLLAGGRSGPSTRLSR